MAGSREMNRVQLSSVRRLTICGAALALLLCAAGPSRAEPSAGITSESGTITWTTYLYQGPSTHYQVADEITSLERVDILGCADGWCRINYGGRTGYVMAEVVAHAGENPVAPLAGVLAQPAASLQPHPRGPCFEANQKDGNGGNELTQFCQK